MVTASVMANVTKAMKARCILSSQINMPCWLDGRKGKNFLSMGNGLIDLEAVAAGKELEDCLRPHDHNWFSPLKLEYDFEISCRCDLWHKVVTEAMEDDQERIDLLQEWFGYLLIPGHEQQQFVCFEGRGGDGKSTIFTVLRAMLGENNVSSLSLSDFSRNFGLDSTIGKALNIADDCSADTVLDLGKFKAFVGGSKQSMDRKNKERLETVPTAKIMCAWNSRLKIKDETDSFWRRLILFPFKKIKSKPNKKMIDVDFWLNSGEMPGILLWAVKGLVRLQHQGEFSKSVVCEAAKNNYRDQRNPAQRFMRDYLTVNPNGVIKCQHLYDLYKHWCEVESVYPISTEAFGINLGQIFDSAPYFERKRKRDFGKLTYCYFGINFSCSEIEGKPVHESDF
jgi:P4 family phage/plasmid primase-like protien